jgi:hypothetical protein
VGRGWITQCNISGHDLFCFDATKEILAGVVKGCEKLAAMFAKKFKIDDPEFVSNSTQKITKFGKKEAFIEAAKDGDFF